MGIIISWLTLTFGFWLAAQIIPGFEVKEIGGAAVVAAVFGLFHFFIGWFFFILIGIGTLGLPLLLGLGFVVRWVVSTIVLKITDAFMESLTIRGWGPAFLASGLFALLSAARDLIVR
jgi:uncharacterized membrane protein YvlD (DUF360 family)